MHFFKLCLITHHLKNTSSVSLLLTLGNKLSGQRRASQLVYIIYHCVLRATPVDECFKSTANRRTLAKVSSKQRKIAQTN